MLKKLVVLTCCAVVITSFTGCRSMRKERMKKKFFKQLTIKHLDTNKDGVVTPLEFSMNVETKRFTADNLFLRIDTNGDNKLTANELDAFTNKLKGMQGMR